MKHLQFMMIGGKSYVDKAMQNEFIKENILRNVKGAIEIDARVCFAVSDKQSKESLIQYLVDNSIELQNIEEYVTFISEKKLLASYKDKMGEIDNFANYNSLIQARKSGDNLRYGAYLDALKLLLIYNAPENQVTEFCDLDQQIDITKNPDFTVSNKEALYSCMHLGNDPTDIGYRRHDMDKGELIKYSKKNNKNPSNRAYTNERSYLVGIGGDQRLLNIFHNVRKIPNFFVLANGENLKNFFDARDSSMPEDLKKKLVRKFHLDFDDTSLGEKEMSRGKKVGFEYAGEKKPKLEPELKPIKEDEIELEILEQNTESNSESSLTKQEQYSEAELTLLPTPLDDIIDEINVASADIKQAKNPITQSVNNSLNIANFNNIAMLTALICIGATIAKFLYKGQNKQQNKRRMPPALTNMMEQKKLEEGKSKENDARSTS